MFINWPKIIEIYSKNKGVIVSEVNDVFFENEDEKIYYPFAKKIHVVNEGYKILRCFPSCGEDGSRYIGDVSKKFIVEHKKVIVEQSIDIYERD